MFGAESDRIAAMRAQQQQKYAEELRRQIEEKQNKAKNQKKTPPAYSTTQNDTMQETVNNINYPNNSNTTTNNNVNNSQGGNNFSVRPPNMARQNQSNPRSNYFNSPTRNLDNNTNDYNPKNNYQTETDNNFNNTINNTNYTNNQRNREDYYSIPTTSTIAPLTLNVQPPSSVMTTTYMLGPTSAMTRGTLNADRSTFPSRVDSLEARIFKLREELAARTEKVNDFNDSIFPSVGREISDLRNRIESESSHEIPQKIQPIRNSIKDQRNSIENLTQNQRDVHSSIASLFSELNGKINTFSPLFNDLQETSKSSFVTLRGDINRHRNQLETSNNKIGKIESQDLSIISKLSALNEDFNESDKALSSHFESLQISTNEIMQSITNQLAYDIQNESQQRESVSTKLQSQVSEVNDRSKSAISRLVSNVGQLDFKDSLEEISKQIANAINSTNNDTEIKANDLTRRFDTFLQECEDSFGSIQNETVSTIEATKSNHMNSMEVIESSLENESRIRTKNANEITAKYAKFRELVKQEEKIQMDNCNRTFNDISFQLKASLSDQLAPMYKDVHGAVYFISHIEETESKLDKLERMVIDTNRNIQDKMSTFQNQFKKLFNEVSNERNSFMKQFDEIDRKIDNLQQNNYRPSVLKRTEIHAIQKEIEIGLDQKVTSIEEEISQIMRQIAELQLPIEPQIQNNIKRNNISKTDNRTEGAIMLESLVNQTNNKKSNTSTPQKVKRNEIIGEADNSLFLTNNKTMEIRAENEEDNSNETEKSNENSNVIIEEEEEEKEEEDKKENSRIGKNVLWETTQKFHFSPPQNIFDQKEENENKEEIKSGRKKASTVKFNLNPTNEETNKSITNGNVLKQKKSHSMPKIDIETENEENQTKFKVDTSFSSNSIKQGIQSLNKTMNELTSVSNSSSSAHQKDDTPLSPKDDKIPFSRTNEIEQILKPEALATLPRRSLSQIVESSKNTIFSDDNENVEEDEEEEEAKDDVLNNKLKSNITDLEKTPPQLASGGNNFDEFKFNPVDFKIDLGLNKVNENKEKTQYDQIADKVNKIVFDVNNKDEIEEEEEVADDDDTK